MRECADCGQRLPRPLPGAGRPQAYCSPACRQRAYRRRGGQASGTTGAERNRRARHEPTPGWAPTTPGPGPAPGTTHDPGAKIHDHQWGQITW